MGDVLTESGRYENWDQGIKNKAMNNIFGGSNNKKSF